MNLLTRRKKLWSTKSVLVHKNKECCRNFPLLHELSNYGLFSNSYMVHSENMKGLMSSDDCGSSGDEGEDSTSSVTDNTSTIGNTVSTTAGGSGDTLCGCNISGGSGTRSGEGCKKILGRHSFHKDVELILNEQAHAEFNAAFDYLTMALYFGRTEIALPGCQGFFMNMYQEELGHGNIFVNYILMRGGHVKLPDIKIPTKDKYNVREAFRQAVRLEKTIKEKLYTVFECAEKHKDFQAMDLVYTQFMEEQDKSIFQMARLYTISKMSTDNFGEYLFDQFVLKSFVITESDNLMNKRKLQNEEIKYDIYK